MGRFRGGIEFPAAQPFRLPVPPKELPAEPVRLTCRHRPEAILGQTVRAGQVLVEPLDPSLPCQMCPVSGTVSSLVTWTPPADDGTGDTTDPKPRSQRCYDLTIKPASPAVPTTLEVTPPTGRELSDWYPALRRLGPWPQPGIGWDLITQMYEATHQRPDMLICVGLDEFAPYPDRSSLLATFPDDAALGTKLLAELVNARCAKMVAANLPHVAGRLKRACRNFRVRFSVADNVFPAAHPTMMVYAHGPRHRKLPYGRKPTARGVMLITPWTAIRIARWLTLGRVDLIHPLLVVHPGQSIPPAEHWAFPGHPLSMVSEEAAETASMLSHRVIVGNPMTGRPIVRPTSAAGPLPPVVPADEHLLTILEEPTPQKADPCISCSWCVEACPTQLRPIRLMQHIESRDDDNYVAEHLPWCIECGLCTHVCPSRLPLAQTLRNERRRREGDRPASL